MMGTNRHKHAMVEFVDENGAGRFRCCRIQAAALDGYGGRLHLTVGCAGKAGRICDSMLESLIMSDSVFGIIYIYIHCI